MLLQLLPLVFETLYLYLGLLFLCLFLPLASTPTGVPLAGIDHQLDDPHKTLTLPFLAMVLMVGSGVGSGSLPVPGIQQLLEPVLPLPLLLKDQLFNHVSQTLFKSKPQVPLLLGL